MNISLTELAATKIKEIRTAEQIPNEQELRIKVVGGGCSGMMFDMYFDKEQEGDIAVISNEVKLIIDQMSALYLDGTSIDYIDGLHGAGFKFDNPSIKSTCGCGSSFSM